MYSIIVAVLGCKPGSQIFKARLNRALKYPNCKPGSYYTVLGLNEERAWGIKYFRDRKITNIVTLDETTCTYESIAVALTRLPAGYMLALVTDAVHAKKVKTILKYDFKKYKVEILEVVGEFPLSYKLKELLTRIKLRVKYAYNSLQSRLS